MLHDGDRKLLVGLLVLNLIGFAIPILAGYGPRGWSSEGGATTYPSAVALFLAGWYANRIHRVRRRVPTTAALSLRVREGAAIWLLMAAGFVFLGLDDLLRFHELLDRAIHSVLAIAETPWTDALDDLFVAAYFVAGLVILWRYRDELVSFGPSLRPILLGLAVTALMIVADVMTNRIDFLMAFFDEQVAKEIFRRLAILEEFSKNGAGMIFAWTMMRVLRAAEMPRRTLRGDAKDHPFPVTAARR